MVTSNNNDSNMPAFCLKLNSHQTHVIDAFQKLYHDELMVDCTLSCSGGTLKAHKLVLSACSPYFTNLFATFINPNQYPVVILKDMPFEDLKLIIEFMYRGEITVPQNLLPSILESAKALMVTGLREIKVANIETGKPRESTSKSSRRNRKRRHKTTGVLDSSGPDSERSEIELSDTEIPDKVSRTDTNVAPPPHDLPAATATIPSSETLAEISISETEETTEAPVCYDLSDDQQTCNSETETPTSMPVPDDNLLLTPSTSNATTDTTSSGANTSTATGLKQALHTPASQAPSSSPVNSGSRTPTSLKDTLKQLRIEKSVCTLQSSGRKMWSEDETRCLIRIWEEESARVWASAGKKMLSLKRIADLLIVENVDRDISQIEGKIKALKRDYKAVKQDKAIPAIQTKMAPYLEKLEAIFSREDLI